ncbi:LemA family protein [Planosporangium thailandense]|uniref:LemA family protein n=1 Tax=Planosporangium thailandense TaxID=765197 RepID=A0ABX0XYZ5_9ACTN|nr:LemA family protein [Planosporangium thailandense]NJC70384.1 LemA family protein [Planosporangium thailandense]
MGSRPPLVVVFGVLVVGLLLLVIGWSIAAYNRLVRLRTRATASWAQIDVQLKRRHSLIPNLVETVKGYAAHERGTLEAVVTARGAAASAHGPAPQAAAEGALTQALGRLFALAEAYPELKADENFRALQATLGDTEDKIAYARQFYNNAVQIYNGAVWSIPTNLVAGVAGFRPEPYFEAAGEERQDVQVRF